MILKACSSSSSHLFISLPHTVWLFTFVLMHTVRTGAEVDVRQHDSEDVRVDDEVAHALVSELWTLLVRGPGCRCHSANTNTRRFQNKTQDLHCILHNVPIFIFWNRGYRCESFDPLAAILAVLYQTCLILELWSARHEAGRVKMCLNERVIRAHRLIRIGFIACFGSPNDLVWSSASVSGPLYLQRHLLCYLLSVRPRRTGCLHEFPS